MYPSSISSKISTRFSTLWLLGAFGKLSVWLFILSYGISEWTGFKNWEFVALLATFAWLVFVVYDTYNIRISYSFENPYVIGLCYPFAYIVLPSILWFAGRLRKRGASSTRSLNKNETIPRKVRFQLSSSFKVLEV